MIYNVADIFFSVTADPDMACWRDVAWHYEPFIVPSGSPAIDITINTGVVDTSALTRVFHEPAKEEGQLSMCVYKCSDNGHIVALQPPMSDADTAWLYVNDDYSRAVITINEAAAGIAPWQHTSAVTSCMMLAYMLASTPRGVLVSHASACIHHGKAYLFIAKSGTGKSTHNKLWHRNIADCLLLNDDHPVVRADGPDGPVAYGSPWSGKTHCYKCISAPVGAIVRIQRADHNRLVSLPPIKAYASLKTSFSGFTIFDDQADAKHAALETIISRVPCYTMECLPNDDAAIVCNTSIKEYENQRQK